MRILHINAGNMYGGVETLLSTLASKAELFTDMEPHFALCFEGRLSRQLEAAGAPVHWMGAVRASRFWTVRQARQRLRDLLLEYSFDAVVCHMPWNLAVFGAEVKRAEIPLVFWQHGTASGRGWVEAWARRTRPDLVISNSQFTAASLPLLFPGVESRVVYYPVETPQVSSVETRSLRRELGAAEDAVVILQVSRMEDWKGHLLHLQALAAIREVPRWVCWIAGGPQTPAEKEYLERLQATAREYGIADRVTFLGQRSDVPALLSVADVFCQPNERPEPFGIVFIEALQAGRPPVTTRIGGATEIVDDSCGILVEPGNASTLADALRRLIESPELRSNLGRSGIARARRLCDPASQMNALGNLILSVSRRPEHYQV